jgi:hypothetical protein
MGVLLLGVAGALLVSRHLRIPAVMPMQRLIGCVSLLWGAREIALMLPWLRRRRVGTRTRGSQPEIEEKADG